MLAHVNLTCGYFAYFAPLLLFFTLNTTVAAVPRAEDTCPNLLSGLPFTLATAASVQTLRPARNTSLLISTRRCGTAKIRETLPTNNLLEDTDGLLRPPSEGGGGTKQTITVTIRCSGLLYSLFLLTCALLMTSSHSKAATRGRACSACACSDLLWAVRHHYRSSLDGTVLAGRGMGWPTTTDCG